MTSAGWQVKALSSCTTFVTFEVGNRVIMMSPCGPQLLTRAVWQKYRTLHEFTLEGFTLNLKGFTHAVLWKWYNARYILITSRVQNSYMESGLTMWQIAGFRVSTHCLSSIVGMGSICEYFDSETIMIFLTSFPGLHSTLQELGESWQWSDSYTHIFCRCLICSLLL